MSILATEKVKLIAPGRRPVGTSATQLANIPDGETMWEGFASLKALTFQQAVTAIGEPDNRLWSGRLMRIPGLKIAPGWRLKTEAGKRYMIDNVSVSTHTHLDMTELV